MSQSSKKAEDAVNIVEAILSGEEEHSIEPLSAENGGSVGTWAQILRVAKADTPDVDNAAVINAVLAEVRANPSKDSTFSATKWVTGGFAVAAMACLVIAVSLYGSIPGISPDETLMTVQSSPDVSIKSATPSKSSTPTSYASLSKTTVNSGAQGIVHLSNHDNSQTIRLTNALRLEAVNGNLRVGLL